MTDDFSEPLRWLLTAGMLLYDAWPLVVVPSVAIALRKRMHDIMVFLLVGFFMCYGILLIVGAGSSFFFACLPEKWEGFTAFTLGPALSIAIGSYLLHRLSQRFTTPAHQLIIDPNGQPKPQGPGKP